MTNKLSMTDPLVSICIPTYNGEKYLRECLDSCLDQSFSDYEVVICDDGSVDGTMAIVESYSPKHPRIKYFRNAKNLGLVDNWNRCIEEAKGSWIKFVFQDDYITHDCLATFLAEVNESTVLAVCERNFILPADASEEMRNYYHNEVRTLVNTSDNKGKIYPPALIARVAIENMCMNFIGEPSLIFFRKSVTKELGAFNRTFKQICDLEFALRIAGIYGLAYIPRKLCAFRIHNESTTSTNIQNKYYQLRYIEPLLFSWTLLYDPHYEKLRRNLNFLNAIKLNVYFRLKTYQAYKVSMAEKRNHEVFADNSEFEQVKKYRRGSLLIKLIAAFKK